MSVVCSDPTLASNVSPDIRFAGGERRVNEVADAIETVNLEADGVVGYCAP